MLYLKDVTLSRNASETTDYVYGITVLITKRALYNNEYNKFLKMVLTWLIFINTVAARDELTHRNVCYRGTRDKLTRRIHCRISVVVRHRCLRGGMAANVFD